MTIRFTSDHPEEKRWRALALPELILQTDIDNVLIQCAAMIMLRQVFEPEGKQALQCYCASDADHANAESIVSQAFADQRLRRAIGEKGSVDVVLLVENILMRSGGDAC